MHFIITYKGGEGSGHESHRGRPGLVGGSLPGKGASTPKPYTDEEVDIATYILEGKSERSDDFASEMNLYDTAAEEEQEEEMWNVMTGVMDRLRAEKNEAYLAKRRARRRARMSGVVISNDVPVHPMKDAAKAVAYKMMKKEFDNAWRYKKNYSDFNKFKAEFESGMKEVLSASSIVVRMQSEDVPKLLMDGRFKSQFETGDSEGSYDPQHRQIVEKNVYAVSMDIDVEKRPIYGYLDEKDGTMNPDVSSYGAVIIKMKPSMSGRSTFIAGDSFEVCDYNDTSDADKYTPLPFPNNKNNPDITAVMPDIYERIFKNPASGLYDETDEDVSIQDFNGNIKKGAAVEIGRAFVRYVMKHSYMEVQMYGGVKLDMIESVMLEENLYNYGTAYPEYSATLTAAALTAAATRTINTYHLLYDFLVAKGIPVTFYKHKSRRDVY